MSKFPWKTTLAGAAILAATVYAYAQMSPGMNGPMGMHGQMMQGQMQGQAGDIPLEPHDIVFVPNNPYRYLRNYVDVVINTYLFSAAAREGAAAFGGVAPSVGVSVGR